MKKGILISDKYFDLNKSSSKYLIEGLNNLKNISKTLYVKDISKIDEKLLLIIKNEDIKLEKYSDQTNIIEIEENEYNNLKDASINLINSRIAVKERNTKETQIHICLNLDGKGNSDLSTGVGFFDHMLEQISKHANIDLCAKVNGDLHVDEHHTIEDTGITLGEAIKEALGNKKGIQRYGFCIPMDETVAKCAIDLGGRSFLNFKCKFNRERVGDFPTEMTEEFFRGLAFGMGANLYMRAKGKNDHHKIEALFKVFAKSLNEACRLDERNKGILPTTKGLL